jgi:Fur family ferric uptake transcriptional regulator
VGGIFEAPLEKKRFFSGKGVDFFLRMIIILIMKLNTEQKRIVWEELASVKSHPTADEVYLMAKARLPRISLATVYRNLDKMADNGEILRLDIPGRKMRFDARTDDHCHLRCECCGSVIDLETEDVDAVLAVLSGLKGKCGVRSFSLELRGLCPACEPETTDD